MTKRRGIVSLALVMLLGACGEPTVIDIVKDSYVSQCSGATVGDMLVGYFPTTSWTAYEGDAEGTFEIRGEGELQFVGMTQTASLRFTLDDATGSVTYDGATLNGVEQPAGMAAQIIGAMCDDATG